MFSCLLKRWFSLEAVWWKHFNRHLKSERNLLNFPEVKQVSMLNNREPGLPPASSRFSNNKTELPWTWLCSVVKVWRSVLETEVGAALFENERLKALPPPQTQLFGRWQSLSSLRTPEASGAACVRQADTAWKSLQAANQTKWLERIKKFKVSFCCQR